MPRPRKPAAHVPHEPLPTLDGQGKVRVWSSPRGLCAPTVARGTVVTGTGRSGTSLLMAVLSSLGLPTGFGRKETTNWRTSKAHAGFELPHVPTCVRNGSAIVDWTTGVEIIKRPQMALRSQHRVWLLPDTALSDVIVPVRDSAASAGSRSANGVTNGGFAYGARSFQQQQQIDEHVLSALIVALAQAEVRTTVLHYPRHALDAHYTARRLSWLLERYHVSTERFVEAHRALSRASLVHAYSNESAAAGAGPRRQKRRAARL